MPTEPETIETEVAEVLDSVNPQAPEDTEPQNLPAVRQAEAIVARGEISVEEIVAQRTKIIDVMNAVMTEGIHYGKIPGVKNPTLLKPGAETINVALRLAPHYESEKIWHDDDHLTVSVVCTLKHIPTGLVIATGEGLCSSRESKYAYRNAKRICPECGVAAIIKGKAEYGGGFVCWRKNDPPGCGANFTDNDLRITSQPEGKIPNPDLPDVFNTVLKMADKRALVAAVLNGTAASDVFTQDVSDIDEREPATNPNPSNKTEWQRNQRRRYAEEHGWSTNANYAVGGKRKEVLERDGFACVVCGTTDEEHKARWGRPITIDHINRDRTDNRLENLQILCLSCHGAKDVSPELVEPKVPTKKDEILRLRDQGKTYQEIAAATEFSVGAVWKWVQRWNGDPGPDVEDAPGVSGASEPAKPQSRRQEGPRAFPVPKTWSDVEKAIRQADNPEEAWELFKAFLRAACYHLFGEVDQESLSHDQRVVLLQKAQGATVWLHEHVEPEGPGFVFFDETWQRRAWGAMLGGAALEIPDYVPPEPEHPQIEPDEDAARIADATITGPPK